MRTTHLLRLTACAMSALLVCAACGDILHLKSGGSVNGQILSSDSENYRVRTLIGIVQVARRDVTKIEPAETPFEEYDARKLQAEQTNTAAGWMQLADWCGESGLQAQRRQHLKQVVKLDPNHAEARTALGYMKVGDSWVRNKKKPTSRPAPTPQEEEDAQFASIRALQGEWMRRIRAIETNMLNANSRRIWERGRDRIMEITDPLAILPLTQTLSTGRTATRMLLVDALGQFAEDEAILNLTVIALVDGSESVRRRALTILAQSGDPRVAQQVREALKSDSDVLIKNAAQALQVLRDPGAVPELIAVLTAQRDRTVEVPVQRYFGSYPTTFNNGTSISVGGQNLQVRPAFGVDRARWAAGVIETNCFERRNVTVFRTDVLEALKAITGQNHGFDAAAWRRWYQEQTP